MLCVFKGRHINLNRTQCYYYLFSHHTYKMQVCRVDLQLEQFARDNVELVPDTMELLTDTELTQYYIQTWSLDFNDPDSPSNGLKMEIVFKRRLTNELLTTYLPSFLLLLMSYATTFFKPFYFEAAVTVNLSILLVTTTLFIRFIHS